MNEIKIIYEDSEILVLDKPSGITVNKSDTTRGEHTVQDFIAENFQFLLRSRAQDRGAISNFQTDQESDFYKRAGIVHRLDKETSGILVVAKNQSAFINLQAQFKERIVEKTYIALVHGHVKSDNGEIIVPVGRLPWNRKKFGVLAGGKPAITFYKVLRSFKNPYTLLELNPKTGRTHQIRVHLKYSNHPIFGDFLYAGRKTARTDRKVLERVFLHAQRISFIHPKTKKKLVFESNLPSELQKTLELIKD